MYSISETLGNLISEYYDSAKQNNRDCRLLVPGLTRTIAGQLHEYLLSKEINSYLVVGETDEPNEEKQYISANGLTSKRIGSFVVIAYPGQLIRIQDSVRGSGGTIRSIAFSEEWPWIDNGDEAFRFDGPVLKRIIEKWTKDVEVQNWLYIFITSGLLKGSKSNPQRATLFLERIIGSFNSQLYPGVSDIQEKFFYHFGLPLPPQRLKDVSEVIDYSANLIKAIMEKCQRSENIREYVKDMTMEIDSPEERDETKKSIDILLDGIGNSDTLDLGLAAFLDCWDRDKQQVDYWRKLNSETLEKLFGLSVGDKAKIVSCLIKSTRGVVAGDNKEIATFLGEQIDVTVHCHIPQEISSKPQKVQILQRQRIITEADLLEGQESLVLQFNSRAFENKYDKKILLRIVLISEGNTLDTKRISLHLCGPDREALVIMKPEFQVFDAISDSIDESPEIKVVVEEPLHLYLLSHNETETDVSVVDEEEKVIGLMKTEMNGIWRTALLLDVSSENSNQINRICRFGDLSCVICFETANLEKGEFTLEDEYREVIIKGKCKKLTQLLGIHDGKDQKPYTCLGQITEATRRRISLAKSMTMRTGWKPILVDFFDIDEQGSGSVGEYINYHGNIEADAFSSVTISNEVSSILNAYIDSREKIIQEVTSRLDSLNTSIENPIYASHPIYVEKYTSYMEELLYSYLEIYSRLLAFIKENQRDLGWKQLFVLTHLDCAVHWDESPIRSSFFLLGPWHPLVIAKRYMVQGALHARAKRIEKDNEVDLKHLTKLLNRTPGFRWVLGLSSDDSLLESAYVYATSDPGWHIAVETKCPLSASQSGLGGLSRITESLRLHFGLASDITEEASSTLARTSLSNYMRAFPSRRSIDIYVCKGHPEIETIKSIDDYLHFEDGPSDQGRCLPGGVRLYLEGSHEANYEATWENPPFLIYHVEENSQRVLKRNLDVYMLPPALEKTFRKDEDVYELPRGSGMESVFCQPLTWITEGSTFLPKCISYEIDTSQKEAKGIGGKFISTLGQICSILKEPMTLVASIHLPERHEAPWMIASGRSIDPAVFVKYVRDGTNYNSEERALWDYRVDLAGQADSIYILSTIPRGFGVAVNGFFGREDIAEQLIMELGSIGIAVGGEALKSGRHALGVLGLAGAVRLFSNNDEKCMNDGDVSFLIPVDSFASFFGKKDDGECKRTDLLAVNIKLPRDNYGKLLISACGVEAKFVSGTFNSTRANAALEQGVSTVNEFKHLVNTGLRQGAMPERLALLELVRFGLRIISPSEARDVRKWVNIERDVFQYILKGVYEYAEPQYQAVLVSTEAALCGVAEYKTLDKGLWVRLTKEHWPGVADTPQIEEVKKAIRNLFDIEQCGTSHGTESQIQDIAAEDETGDLDSKTEESNSECQKNNDLEHSNPEEMENKDARPNAEGPSTINVNSCKSGLDGEKPLKQIFIGVDEGRKAIYLNPQSPIDPLDNLNLMITGSSGTGKTQLLKYLVCQLRAQEKNVFIMDFKNDFADDNSFCEKANLERVYISFDGLPFNPLIPYPVEHPGTKDLFIQSSLHISGISSVLKKTYGLGDQQQNSVKQAIVEAFRLKGAPVEGTIPYSTDFAFPDFGAVGDILHSQNVSAYNRLDPLFTLGIFQERFSNVPFDNLLGRSVVLDLSRIPSDEIKNALAQLIVLSAHSYFNARAHSGAIRQFFVFDEAHRVTGSNYMLQLVRECRAYGIGVILSSQYPSDFPGDISASMATKIIHGNGRDSDRVKAIVQLLGCPGREGEVANLARFQAVIDNRHFPHMYLQTMNYPLFLVWSMLQQCKHATRQTLEELSGIDSSKLPIDNLVQQLEKMGLAEERGGEIVLIRSVDKM